MENWQAFVASGIFIMVILLIVGDWLEMTVVGFLGGLLLVFFNILTMQEAINCIARSHGTLALFLGVMILVRSFQPTQIFEYLGTQIVFFAKGKGRRLLLAIVGITTIICSVLPNATTVMLLAPLLPPMAAELGIDFVPLLILMVFVANSAGLITLVGDPATYIVGDSINLSFMDYLYRLGLGGVIAVGVIVALLPWLFRRTWRKELADLSHLPHPTINHPRALAVGAVIMTFVLVFFVIGESLPVPVSPPAVALMGAALALLLAHHSKIDTVNHILRDVDWSTLIFFMSVFVLIGGLEKTGVIAQISNLLAVVLGTNIFWGALILLILTAALSSVIPNIPLVVAMVPLLQKYLIQVGMLSSDVLDPGFNGAYPPQVLPLFYAMMFGATLGGNGTLVGASANIVAAGIAELNDRKITFQRFLAYGVPVTVAQVSALGVFLVLRFLVWL